MKTNFDHCLSVTLRYEGGYSNHPDDPGGPTMRGITQAEYDRWRKAQGKSKRDVKSIGQDEIRTIYRTDYWNALTCDDLPLGLDLCVFDAAVNSGVRRARAWLDETRDIDAFTAKRLAFLQGLGRLWRVFGRGWRARVSGVRDEAKRMATQEAVPLPPRDETLHAGMKGSAVHGLQMKLRKLGYPCGEVDGIFGEQTYRAVLLYQRDHDLAGDEGVWQSAYDETLEKAAPMLPKRRAATRQDLERAGDGPLRKMNLLQRLLSWIFGASAAGQLFYSDSLLQSFTAARDMIDPVEGFIEWTASHRFMLLAVLCMGLIGLVHSLRQAHVEAYRRFDYQGKPAPEARPHE